MFLILLAFFYADYHYFEPCPRCDLDFQGILWGNDLLLACLLMVIVRIGNIIPINDIQHNRIVVGKKQLVSVEPDNSLQQRQPNKDALRR